MSWVWLTIVILIKVKCTLRGHILRFWAVWGDLGLCIEELFLPYSGYSALLGLNSSHYGLLWEVSGDPPAGNPPGSGDPFHIAYTVLAATKAAKPTAIS